MMFGHVMRMPQERLAKKIMQAIPNGKRPVGRPRTRWSNYITNLAWTRLGLTSSELAEVGEDREHFRELLELLPPRPSEEDKRAP